MIPRMVSLVNAFFDFFQNFLFILDVKIMVDKWGACRYNNQAVFFRAVFADVLELVDWLA